MSKKSAKPPKTPKAIIEFLDKMEWEGGLGGMIEYGIDIAEIKAADPELGKTLSNLVGLWEETLSKLRKYPEYEGY